MTKGAFSRAAAWQRNSTHHWDMNLLALVLVQLGAVHFQTGSGVICAAITATEVPQPRDIVVVPTLSIIGRDIEASGRAVV